MFFKLERNADMEKTIKTPESERTEKSRYFALLNSKIGRETIEVSYIMVNSNNKSYIANKYWFFEDIRKSDVGKTTKNTQLNQKCFSRYPSPKIIQNGREVMEKSEIL